MSSRRGQPQGDLLQAVHLEADVVDARELPAPLDPGHRVVLEVQHRQVEIAVGQEEAADRGVIDAPDLLHAEDVHVELGRLLGVLGGQRDVLDLRHGGLLGPSLLPRPRGLRKRIAVGRRDLRYTTPASPIPPAVPKENFAPWPDCDFTLQPVYARLATWSGRPTLASVAVVLAAGLAIVGSVVGFVSVFVTQAVTFAAAVREELKPGGALATWVTTVTGWLGHLGISPDAIVERLRAAAGDIATGSASVAGTVASVTVGSLLGLFFALLTMHVTLRHWARIITTVAEVSPLRRDDTRALLEEFRTVGRITLSGTVVTGLVQGALAGLGFWMTGVPRPLFLGIAAAIASLVPAVGTLLVWVPAGLYLLAVGSPGAAVAELAWGALVVVGFSDYVIRPRLVGDEGMPAILTFLALFGSLQVLGLPGLIAGPVLMALAVAVLRLYAREVRGGRAS